MKTALLETSGDSSKEAEKEAVELAAQITFKGESEKEKSSQGSTATSTSNVTSQPQAASTTESVATVNSQMGASSMGVALQYYAAYQQGGYPYYATGYPMYHMMNANPLPAQGYQQPSAILPNQTGAHVTPTNQNTGDRGTDSGMRQRTVVNQGAASQNMVQPVSQANSVVQRQPRITQSSMASLIVLWVLVVSIAALVCRRIFMISQ